MTAPAGTELHDVMDRALRLLGVRARSETELRDRLRRVGYEADAVDGAIERLYELNLLDDREFARRWVAERSRVKGLAGRALMAELSKKGIARELAEEVLAEAELDEVAGATEVAARSIRKLAGLPLAVQARRVQAAVLRKGYSFEVADRAVKAVLPPEGWD